MCVCVLIERERVRQRDRERETEKECVCRGGCFLLESLLGFCFHFNITSYHGSVKSISFFVLFATKGRKRDRGRVERDRERKR